jgi:YbbR domain-containing protein
MKFKVKTFITDNFSYKVVSLFIALILWLTILGRRDFTVTRSFELDFSVAAQSLLLKQSSERLKVKVSGPRTALRRFMDAEAAQVVSIDLAQYAPGQYDVEIPISKIDVPFGVKVLGIQPTHVQVQIEKKDNQ